MSCLLLMLSCISISPHQSPVYPPVSLRDNLLRNPVLPPLDLPHTPGRRYLEIHRTVLTNDDDVWDCISSTCVSKLRYSIPSRISLYVEFHLTSLLFTSFSRSPYFFSVVPRLPLPNLPSLPQVYSTHSQTKGC